MNQEDTTPRWIYRFKNYSRAFKLLQEAAEQERPLTQLEKEGFVQRFEYTMELAWKTMKDFLESEKMVIEPVTPAHVIRTAFEAKLIQNGQTWMDALDARNKMAHTYDFATFEKVIIDCKTSFLPVMLDLYMYFLEKMIDYER